MTAEASPISNLSSDTATNAAPDKTQDNKKVAPKPTVRRPESVSGPEAIQDVAPGLPNIDMGKFFEDSRERLKDAFEQANSRFDHVRSAARDTSDVLQDCHSATVSGLKEISERTFEHVQEDVERVYDYSRSLSGVKSLAELAQINNEFVRAIFESRMEQLRAVSELTSSMLKSSMEPLQSGMSNVMEQARKRST